MGLAIPGPSCICTLISPYMGTVEIRQVKTQIRISLVVRISGISVGFSRKHEETDVYKLIK